MAILYYGNMTKNFYHGKDDHSAREIIMQFGGHCYNADIDGLQYDYDNGEVILTALLEYKHPCTKTIDVKLIEVPRKVAELTKVPLFVLIYFTKPNPTPYDVPGDGYGSVEKPPMFYVIPGNGMAWKTLSEYNGCKMWYSPNELAVFLHHIRGSHPTARSLKHLSSARKKYPVSTLIDVDGLTKAFDKDLSI